MIRPSLLSSMAALALLLASCTAAPPPKPRRHVEIPVAADATRVLAPAPLDAVITIHLPPLASPGTVWTIVLNDGRYLQPVGRAASGVVEGSTATFQSNRPGRKTIRFFALPPGAREAVPNQTYEVVLEIE